MFYSSKKIISIPELTTKTTIETKLLFKWFIISNCIYSKTYKSELRMEKEKKSNEIISYSWSYPYASLENREYL